MMHFLLSILLFVTAANAQSNIGLIGPGQVLGNAGASPAAPTAVAAAAVEGLWTNAKDIGVDCTGSANASTVIQAFFNANPSGKLMFPPSCEVSITTTIAIGSSSNPVLSGPFFAGNGAALDSSPHLYWRGTSPGYMFTFTNVDHPIVQNLAFQTDVQELNQCPLGFLKFDGDGGTFTPTNAQVIGNSFSNSACRDENFIGINIAETSVNNNENYVVYNNTIVCSGSGLGSRIATDGVTNGTALLTAASAPFVPGFAPLTITGLTDLGGGFLKFLTATSAVGLANTVVKITGMNPSVYNGQRFVSSSDAAGFVTFGSLTVPFVSGGTKAGTRIRISYAGGLVDTTVATYVSATNVTLASGPAWSQSGVQIFYGSIGFGIALRNGASQNAIQQQFSKIQYTNCATGIHMQGGGAQISQPSGGFSDTGVFIGGFLAQNTTIDYYASEADFQAIVIQNAATPPIGISNGRFSNSSQPLSGHVVPGNGIVMLTSNNFNFSAPTGGVFIGKTGNANITSISNIYPGTWTQSGLPAFDEPPVVSIKDTFDTTGAPSQTSFGCWGLVAPCFVINNNIPSGGGVSFDVASGTAVTTTGAAVGMRSRATLGGGTTWTAIRGQPTGGRVNASQTMVEAGWDAVALDVTSGMSAAYGFRARTPPTVTGGTLTNIYGVYIDKQKATNITNGYGVFQADAGDSNVFAGPMSLTGLGVTPGGKQPVCIDTGTGVLYKGSAGAC